MAIVAECPICGKRFKADEKQAGKKAKCSQCATVFLVGYERFNSGAKLEHVQTAVHRERMRVNQDLRSRLWMLGTIGATAPFVGLFGTVIGIMTAMGGFKGDDEVKFSMVSGPISEALVVTAAGILVAVEAVILFNFFSQRASRIATEMKLLTDEFLELLLDQPRDQQPKGNRKVDEESDTKARAKGDAGPIRVSLKPVVGQVGVNEVGLDFEGFR